MEPKRLRDGAPNVLIILIDDVGPGTPSTYGGEINTPTLTRVAQAGISYNRFHSTAMCSPTRGALLTGRNHTRIGCGQICELSNDWDGFSGTVPKSSAMIPEVLRHYGYNTAAWGKWHNTPAEQTTSKGPFEFWPTGYGFEYFHGFLAGEASQYEPTLVRNTMPVETPKTSGGNDHYHVSEGIADDAITWLREQQAFAPDKPFFLYWATGASHGPHQVAREWADKYKGKFDDGWDKYRERVFARQKAMGWIPKDAKLTPRPDSLAAWDSIPEEEKPFQRRLMEVFAGFTEHADAQAGRVIDEIERQGRLDNTIVIYIWGDNGSSAEGQNGTISELLAQNGIKTTIPQHIKVLDELGGLEVLGSPKTDNMYHAGWAWAGSTPYRSTKLVAAHLGGTRQPMAVSWPKGIEPDPTPRPQFHHVIDIVPTIYEVVGIKPPRVVNGIPQDEFDGTSMAYTFADANVDGQRTTQFFDVMGSRGIYHDGWFASAFGPRIPWKPGLADVKDWNPQDDVWELYNLEEDWTQANDLAAEMPEKLEEMKALFLIESAKNKNLPIGGGLWTAALHPEDGPATPYTTWTFNGPISRMPEFAAPKLQRASNTVTMELDVPENPNGVLYALGGFSAGLTCYVDDGTLAFEYNLFMMERTVVKAKEKLPTGRVTVEVETTRDGAAISAPLDIVLRVNGKETGNGRVPMSASIFTANECLDIGQDLGSPVSKAYYEEAPYAFNGKVLKTTIAYPKQAVKRDDKMRTTATQNLSALLIVASWLTPVSAEDEKRLRVTVDNFRRAETDMYFARFARDGGFGKFKHERELAAIDRQTVIRLNRDTLYSFGVFDLDAGPITVTLPDAGERYMAVQVIDQDHYVPDVFYAPGTHTLSKEKIGTRYVCLAIRTFVNPNDPADLEAVHALQNAIKVDQKAVGEFQVPAWDQESLTKVREALLALAAANGGIDSTRMFGRKDEVDPVQHLIGTAAGWGGNPPKAALYAGAEPEQNDGKTVYRLTVNDVPVDGFWSVSVYNKDGFFEKNERNAYTVNNVTAEPNDDGSVTIQFGGDESKPNCIPITPGWNYVVRMYCPRKEILDGTWKFPEAQLVE